MTERAKWQSRTIFLFAAIGSAVGLGNVWRFPYLAYKFGGGAFLIPYLIALLTVGIPLLLVEFSLGQFFQKGAVGAFRKIHPKAAGIGSASLMAGFIVVIYYAVVMAWALHYLVYSFQGELPWGQEPRNYFLNEVLHAGSTIGESWAINPALLIALAVVWILIYFIIRKGVKSVGKVVAITMPLPILLLVVLFVRAITLEGSTLGITEYIYPDFSLLLQGDIWLAAASQTFFTLSLGFGIMIAYASYNKPSQNVLGDTLITSFANAFISLFSGFVVFAILGYMAGATGVEVGEVAQSGPGLAFIVFPQALSLMPWPAFFSILFFITLLMLGIDSAFSLVEAVNTSIHDRFPQFELRHIAKVTCLIAFLAGVLFTTGSGLYLLDIVDHFITHFGLVTIGILEAITVGWIFGAKKVRTIINQNSNIKLGRSFDFLIRYFVPAVLILLLIFQLKIEFQENYGDYPGWAIAIGWGTVALQFGLGLWMGKAGKKKAENG